MHTRRLIALLLGAWFCWVVVAVALFPLSTNLSGNLAKAPPVDVTRALATIGEPMTQQLFRFVGAEVHRILLERGALADVLLVGLITWQLFVQNYSRRATVLAGILLLFTFASAFLLTPQFVTQGRVLDFRPLNPATPERVRFGNLVLMIGTLTGFRVFCAVWISAILLRRGESLRRRRTDIDAVDHA